MASLAISVEGLSKRYELGHLQHDTLRDQLAHKGRSLIAALRGRAHAKSTTEEFWALQDVSFSVEKGEVLGVIGRNGAGKSTLLKILSRITEPTHGTIRVRGRVASLLEVGTGFHPELTGRDNIFLNGALLGMRREEIRRKFDAIVSFAEVEQFLDTPVKRYSSGMYVRLAFAVAAHLEPDILIVDEVLAVGDAGFQQKCLGKMNEVADSGRTILFVSHNINAIRSLTTRCVYLKRGTMEFVGPTAESIDLYTKNLRADRASTSGQHASILRAALVDVSGMETPTFPGGDFAFLKLLVETDGHPLASVEATLTDLAGTTLGLYSPGHFAAWRLPAAAGVYELSLKLRMPRLATGNYGFDLSTTIHGFGSDHYLSDALVFGSESRVNHPGQWELRKEYNVGHFIMDEGVPVATLVDQSPSPCP